LDDADSVEGCGCELSSKRRKRQAGAAESNNEDAIIQTALESHIPWGIPVAFDNGYQRELSMTYLTHQAYINGTGMVIKIKSTRAREGHIL
jgi:hypothetical protein